MTSYRWNTIDAAAGYDQAATHIHPHYVEIQDVILAALPFERDDVFTVVDAGGGSGRLVERILDSFPQARGLVVDQSEAFLRLAEDRLGRFGSRAVCQCVRLQDDWPARLNEDEVHAIVSMSAIHHLDADEKLACYGCAFQSLATDGIFINGDEVRLCDDDAYLSALRDWARHMQQVIGAGLVPEPMHETIKGWIHRNIDGFGQPKSSGDDCHQTVDVQQQYLRQCGFTSVEVLWAKNLWSVFCGRKQVREGSS